MHSDANSLGNLLSTLFLRISGGRAADRLSLLDAVHVCLLVVWVLGKWDFSAWSLRHHTFALLRTSDVFLTSVELLATIIIIMNVESAGGSGNKSDVSEESHFFLGPIIFLYYSHY